MGMPALSSCLLASQRNAVDWDAAGGSGGGAHGTAGAAAAQQVLPGGDWRGAQRRQARIATGARCAGGAAVGAGLAV